MNRRTLLALAGLALPTAALAFPERAITLIVPFPPAGSTDIAARLLADRLSARLAMRVVVENRAGAGGAIGSEAAKRATADGHTLLFASASSHGANPAVFADLPYDAVRDFAPVALTGVTPLALAVAPNGPRDLDALRGALAEAPGTYGSAGAGSITHLAAELFLARTRLRAEHIPYRGGGPALEALARGEVSFVFETLASLSGIAGDGRVRLLALATPARAATLPQLATLEEGSLAPFDVSTWNAMLAPRGTPAERIATLAAAVQACLAEPTLADRLASLGVMVPPPTGPEATARFIAAEVTKFRAIAGGAGLRIERP